MDRVEHRQDRGVVGGVDVEFVEVGFVAVAAADARDLLVGAVVDDLFALAEALWRDVALPPGDDRFAFVLLHLQVGPLGALGERVEPDELAGAVEDHRAVLAGSGVGRREDVAGGLGRGSWS